MKLGAVLLAVSMLAGCHEARLDLPQRCTRTSECPSGYHCGPHAAADPDPHGVCRGDVACAVDDECCLGERCELSTSASGQQAGRCRARQMCSGPSPCADAGTTCQDGLCIPRACGADAACPGATTCLWGRCMAHVPCGGHCGPDAACAVLIDRCVPLHAAHGACQPGELRVLTNDAARLAEGCALLPELTACKPLPPLPEGRIGMPGVLLSVPSALAHVAYDQTYGDLTLTRYAKTPPFKQIRTQVLSGLAQGGLVIGDVLGPRGGVAEPGPDHGTALDAASDGQGRIRVAYRDNTLDALRYLEVQNDGQVVGDHVLRQELGAGTAIALVLGPGGKPVVLAFSAALPGQSSHLRLLTAQTASPRQAADWQVQELDSEPPADATKPCGDSCAKGQVCARLGEADVCVVPATSCAAAGVTTACLPAQVCYAGKCLERRLSRPPLEDVAQGRGAWLDVTVGYNDAVLAAAYSPGAGDLALYRGQPGAPFTRTLVSGSLVNSNDIGRFVATTLGADGRLLAACEDSQNGRLLLVRELAKGVAIDVLDDGNRPDGHHRVGADIAVISHTAGGLLLACQDTRRADLLLVRVPKPGGPVGARSVLVATHAAGFAASIAAVGSKAFAVASTTLRVQPDASLSSRIVLSEVVWSGE